MAVELDINKRWESGTDHHPKSVEIYERLEKLDWEHGGDALCLKSGGDGDNGEHLMYLLDIIFEQNDAVTAVELKTQSILLPTPRNIPGDLFASGWDAAIEWVKKLNKLEAQATKKAPTET